MKKILLLLTLIFTITTSAQYTILSAIDINEGMEDQYLQLEEFFGPVHDLAIEKGIQDLQAVFKVVSTSDDGDNVAGLEWAVTGAPETFVLDVEGRICERMTGPLNDVATPNPENRQEMKNNVSNILTIVRAMRAADGKCLSKSN